MNISTERFATGQIVENDIYYSAIRYNGLFKSNLNTHETVFVSLFDGHPKRKVALHSNSFQYKDKIIFLPYNGSEIHIYDLNNNQIKSVSLCEEGNYTASFSESFFINGSVLWIVPFHALGYQDKRPFITVDLDNYKVVERWDINEKISPYIEKSGYALLFQNAIYEKRIWIPVVRTDNLISFNPVTEETEVFKIEGGAMLGVSAAQDGLWITNQNSLLIKWSPEKGVIKNVDFLNRTATGLFSNIYEYNDKIYTLPTREEYIYIFDLNKDAVIGQFPVDEEKYVGNGFPYKTMHYGIRDNKMLIYTNNRRRAGCIDLESDEYTYIELDGCSQYEDDVFGSIEDSLYIEGLDINLNGFVDRL